MGLGCHIYIALKIRKKRTLNLIKSLCGYEKIKSESIKTLIIWKAQLATAVDWVGGAAACPCSRKDNKWKNAD